MKIITVPHPTLRAKATPVQEVDQKLRALVKNLNYTLSVQKNPRGVGLAANQIDVLKRVFATNISENDQVPPQLKIFINPVIVEHSRGLILGPNAEDEILEGCLSIPALYGPVPRYSWIQLEYQVVEEDKLRPATKKFTDFEARVIQHELDHLDGILFTDYSLEYDLPVYRENHRTQKFEEIDKRILEAI